MTIEQVFTDDILETLKIEEEDRQIAILIILKSFLKSLTLEKKLQSLFTKIYLPLMEKIGLKMTMLVQLVT